MRFITDEGALRQVVGGDPVPQAVRKQLDHLDEHARRFLAAAPFCVLATSGVDGCDATPRGDEPGFARPLDRQTLALPERPGNRRLDSLHNILANPHVGLLFVVPGVAHTLRVNGTARLVAGDVAGARRGTRPRYRAAGGVRVERRAGRLDRRAARAGAHVLSTGRGAVRQDGPSTSATWR